MIHVLRRTAFIAASVALSIPLVAGSALLGARSGPLGVGSAAYAADPTPAVPPSSSTYDRRPDKFSLTVSPTRINLVQGDVAKKTEILVLNRGQAALPITVQKRNFTVGSDGALDFQEAAPYSASTWVSIDDSEFVLQPGASRTVSATVTVPPDPEPGDHQLAIVFLVPAVQGGGNVRINRGIGVPTFVTVAGPTDDSVDISDLSASSFLLRGPTDVTATVKNVGTVHRDFRGATPLQLKAAGAPAVFPDFTVMRGATRDISTSWKPPFACICHVKLSIANADGSPQSAAVRIIVFPLDLLAALLVLLAAAFLGVRWRRRRFNRKVDDAAALLAGSAGDEHR